MGSLASRIKDTLRWCRISRDGDDGENFPVQQVEYLGKTADAAIHFPYGFHANVPEGTLALMVILEGNTESRVALPSSPIERKKVAVGEVVFFHPLTGSKIHFKADGSVEVDAKKNLDLTVTGDANVTVTGDVNVTVTGDATITVTGTATITGTTKLVLDGASIEAGLAATLRLMDERMIAVFNTHKHSGGGNPPTTTLSTGSHATSVLKGK